MRDFVAITLTEHLTAAKLKLALATVDEALRTRSDKLWLIVDVLQMAGYDSDARTAFVAWNRANRPRLHGVAIVTHRTLWRVVVAAMSLASGQQMRAFETLAAAEAHSAM